METQIKAEIKSLKFGEILTVKAEGNPELSLLLEESVETRRAVCIRCGTELTGQQRKYCSTKCSSYCYCLRKGRFSKPGVGSGGNQLGEKNHQYKNGIGTFRKRAFEQYGYICNKCGAVHKLCVHHIDEDRTNNIVENLKVLCKRCHQSHHETRNNLGQYTKG